MHCQFRRGDLEPNNSPSRRGCGIEEGVKKIHHLPWGQRNRVKDILTRQLYCTLMLLFSSNAHWKERQAFTLWVTLSISLVRQNFLFTRSPLNNIYAPRTQGCPNNTSPDEQANTNAKYYHLYIMRRGEIKDLILIFHISIMSFDFIRADCDLLV